VTLCKPREERSNYPQFCKLRNLITSMGVKYGLNVVLHKKNVCYDNWITEFYIIGANEFLKHVCGLVDATTIAAAAAATTTTFSTSAPALTGVLKLSSPSPGPLARQHPSSSAELNRPCASGSRVQRRRETIEIVDDGDVDYSNGGYAVDNNGVSQKHATIAQITEKQLSGHRNNDESGDDSDSSSFIDLTL